MLIEARLTWDGDVLAVAHAKLRGVVRVSDFALPGWEDDRTIVAEAGALTRDAVARGNAIVWLSLGEDAERVPSFDLRGSELRTSKGVALAAVLHATILAMAFIGRSAAGADEESGRFDLMKGYLAASDARAVGDAMDTPAPEVLQDDLAGTKAKPNEAGTAGNPMARTSNARAATAKGHDRAETNRDELKEAREFGMIGLLTPSELGRAGGDPFATYDGPDAVGSIFGATIGDSFGMGGAALSGVGIGGGGKGEGVGDPQGFGWGRCGATCFGTANGQGFGSSRGRVSRGHEVRTISVRRCDDGCTTQVNGRLPPEVVQRVVRQSFGRMRACYEAGLVRNPELEGRIAVKFVIDRSGAVAMVSATERTLMDSSVASCVERAFQQMSFPEPAGGIVTVVYPIVFSS